MMLLLQFAALVLIHGVVTQAVTLEAKVSVGGVKGTVTFSQDSPGSQVTVNMALTGPNSGQAATWQLHTFRLNYDVMERCGVANLGPRILTSISGSVASGDQPVAGLELSGMDSIEGRSIAFLTAGGDPVACATIERSQKYYTARAIFRKSVLGHVIFRQHGAASPSSLGMTRVTVDLYSDGSESSARDLEWRITDNSDCSSVGNIYNPTSATGACNSGDHASCAVGNLIGKLGSVPVGATMGSARWTKMDSNLHLPATSSKSVAGKTLQLLAPGQASPVACATISVYTARTGIAVFDNDGVTGSITVTQPSPLDPTTTSVNLVNLRSKAGGYHVHEYPVPQRVARDRKILCSGAKVAGHFNPFDIVYTDQSPGAAVSTEDMYEVGDLSKKYGLLNDLDARRANYTDYNLPLFGVRSVLGRSLVVHYNNPGTPRWICANILDSAPLTSALATFTFPVIGHVLLQQREGEEGETSVYYRLNYADGVSAPSQGHAWALHDNDVTEAAMLADDVNSRCVNAGDVINGFGVSGTGYDSQCGPSAPLRCRLGDLEGKHGAVSVRASADPAHPAIGYFTDVNLPLRGPRSVLGKSLVLGAAGGGSSKLACANLHSVFPYVLEARDWEQVQDFGSVTFTQQVGVVATPTTITVDLQGASSIGEQVAYGIKDRPVVTSGSCDDLGGFYNPFETMPNDEKAVGDLTGKFGALQSGGGAVTQEDPSLDLWGPMGVAGRAFSVAPLPGESGSSSGGTEGCANIVPKPMPRGKLFTAKAVFTGEVTGYIMLIQHMYPGGALTPTTVVVNLRKASGSQTTAHNWHTHVYPVGDDAAATPGRCASTGGHYNPFKVNVKSQYIECSLDNPLRCEVGDQSNKLGTYDMGSGPRVSSDVYLPLAGPFGVVGRSIVVHVPDRGAPRLACADILPDDLDMSYTYTISTPPSMNRAPLVQKIAEALHTETYNVAAQYLTTSADNCTNTRVYFLGMDQAMYKDHFIAMLRNEPSTLGMYRPANHCSTSSGDSVKSSTALAAVMLILLILPAMASELLNCQYV